MALLYGPRFSLPTSQISSAEKFSMPRSLRSRPQMLTQSSFVMLFEIRGTVQQIGPTWFPHQCRTDAARYSPPLRPKILSDSGTGSPR